MPETISTDDFGEEDADFLERVDGLFVGLLRPEEVEQFDRLCVLGVARRTYEHPAARLLGLATCRQVLIPLARARLL